MADPLFVVQGGMGALVFFRMPLAINTGKIDFFTSGFTSGIPIYSIPLQYLTVLRRVVSTYGTRGRVR